MMGEKACAQIAICPQDMGTIRSIFNDKVIKLNTIEDWLEIASSLHGGIPHEYVIYITPHKLRKVWLARAIVWLLERFQGTVVLPASFHQDEFNVAYSHMLPPLIFPKITIYGKNKNQLNYVDIDYTAIPKAEVLEFLDMFGGNYPIVTMKGFQPTPLMAKVEKFNKVKVVKVYPNEMGRELLKQKPEYIFGKRVNDDCLWIERGEDEYASPHYDDKPAVKLYRNDWIAVNGED